MAAPQEAPKAGEIERQEFGARELTVVAETASAAVAAQATAATQARYVVAMQRPRSWDDVRQKLLKECRRSSFAAVARYRKPVGAGVEGPSIRFAEAALRCMGNVLAETSTIYDDDRKRIVRVSVTDLESNLTYPKDVVIQKTVERNRLQEGQTPISSRKNSSGKTVYTVEATDDDLLNKENALISKALRTSGLRILPGDILDECMQLVQQTIRSGVEADPDGERKKIADAFATLNVQPSALAEYLRHELSLSTPAEIVELRALFSAIRDGEATWLEALAAKAPPEGDKPDAKIEALRDKLDAAKKKKKDAAPPEQPPQSAQGGEESTGGAVSPWTEGDEPRCVECKRLRSRVGQVGHDEGCSMGGER